MAPPRQSSAQLSAQGRVWVLAVCGGLPLVAFGAAGGLWLYQHGWLGWAAGGLLLGEAVALFLFRRWAQAEQPLLPQPSAELPEHFSAQDEEAWRLIGGYQERIEGGEIGLGTLEDAIGLGREIVERIAAFYRPDDPEPLMAIPVPLLFRALEETAHDLATISADLPFAHRITISQILRAYRVGKKLKPAYELYRVYRILSPLVNWKSALFRFVVTDRLFDLTKQTLQEWLLGWYVDRVGYHAIALYSGKLLLDQPPTNPPGQRQGEAAQDERAGRLEAAPSHHVLRVLVLGQVKSGKSSLVNALFGEVRAAVDVVPTTVRVTPYVLDRLSDGDTVVVLDMGGYDDPTSPHQDQDHLEAVLAEALQADCVLLVCSAVQAAREPDRRIVQSIRDYFSARPQLRPPPMLVALTHIDLLRPPLVWQPPYDIAVPQSAKARAIRAALEAVGGDLGVAASHVVPVCLHPERLYNIDDALIPALVDLVPAARRTALVRSVSTLREQEQWTLLGRQARAAGRFLFDLGGHVLHGAVDRPADGTRS